MASLKQRGDVYYIRFFAKINGERKRKSFSLGTTRKREAQKLLFEYEEKFRRGEIDPFNGWTPKKEAANKRQSLKGRYVPLNKAANQFINERSQANKQTKDNYRRHMNMLEDHLGQTMPVTEITETDIREFCFRSDIKPATQVSYLRHYKVFFNWLYEKGITNINITKDIKPPKAPQKISQKTISREELDKLFKAFDKFYKKMEKQRAVTKPHQKRLWFKPMINTIYYCGLRAKEAVNLRWANVDLKEGYIRIVNSELSNTKSGKDRTIPVRKDLLPILKNWYTDQKKPKEGYVFPSATGFNEWQKMDAGALSKSFKKFVRKAKLPETITLHGLRHSCATELLRKGVPINLVSKYLGHSSVEVTQIYEHLDETDLKKTLEAIE